MKLVPIFIFSFLLPLSSYAGPACEMTITPYQEGDAVYEIGKPITTSLSCTGSGPITYQWRLFSVPVPGATGPSFTFTPDQNLVYQLYVSASDETGSFQGGWERAVRIRPTADFSIQGPDPIYNDSEVIIDGRASSGAGLNYNWTVLGPDDQPYGIPISPSQFPIVPTKIGIWKVQLWVHNGLKSNVVDKTFEVANRPPIAKFRLEHGANPNPIVGRAINFNSSDSSDPDGEPLTFHWQVTGPPGYDDFIEHGHYVPNVPGDYVFRLTVNDGHVDSAPFDLPITVLPSTLPPPEFKVLLASDNQEYLFDDCAPNNDDCKQFASTFTAGEFLVNDTINLDATESTGGGTLNYKWTVKKLPSGAESSLNGKIATYQIPSEGDYEVKLVVNNGVDSLPLIKKFKGELSIEPTYPSPGPFYQKKKIGNNQDNPNYLAFNWGNTGIDDFSKFGCAVVATGNLLNRDLGLTSTRQVDSLYKDKNVYHGINRIYWPEIARARNSQLPDTTKFWKYQNKGNDPVVAEKFARKRKFGGLVVNSLSDPTNLNKQHFVTLSGVVNVGPQKILRIVDPADEGRDRLDDEPFSNEFRALRAFEIEPIATPDTLRVYVSTSNTGIKFSSLRASGETFRLSNRSVDVQSFAIGTVTLENLGDDSDPTSTESSGGYLMTVPDAPAGNYSVSITATAQTQGEVEIRVFNTSNQVNLVKIVGVSLSPGQTKEIPFDVSDQDVTLGTLDVSGFAVRKDLNGKSVTRIEGTLNTASGSNGFNFSTEAVNISLSSLGYELLPGDLQNISGTFRYINYASQFGLRFVEIQPNEIFKLEVVDLNLLSLVSNNSAPLEIKIGDDRLSGVVKKESIIAASKMWLELSKLSYVNGERAEGLIATSVRPTNSEVETYLDLKIDGQQNLTSVDSTQSWTFRSPRLISGEHSIVASLFLQNKRLAGQVGAATKAYRLRIFEIDERLGVETDPEIVQQLMDEKQGLYERISALESTLRESRTAIGTPLYDSIIVQ